MIFSQTAFGRCPGWSMSDSLRIWWTSTGSASHISHFPISSRCTTSDLLLPGVNHALSKSKSAVTFPSGILLNGIPPNVATSGSLLVLSTVTCRTLWGFPSTLRIARNFLSIAVDLLLCLAARVFTSDLWRIHWIWPIRRLTLTAMQ